MSDNYEIEMVIDSRNGINGVDARELHKQLEVGRDFSTWIRNRIEKAGFIEGEDYSTTLGNNTGSRGKPKIEYFVSLDMAKHLAMMENNERGMMVRRYFIEAEKRYRQQVVSAPQSMEEALELALSTIRENRLLTERIEENQPKVDFYNELIEIDECFQMSAAVKLAGLSFGSKIAFKRLRQDGYLISKGGPSRFNLPYQKYILSGHFVVKESVWFHPETGERRITPVTNVTNKGIDLLIRLYGEEES